MAGVDPRWQAQLNRDLATGAPIPYRRVPGRARRQYYNPLRPQDPIVSEHYVVRVYKPALSDLERMKITEYVRESVHRQYFLKRNLADQWQLKKETEGRTPTSLREAQRDPEFIRLYNDFRAEAFAARHIPIGGALRNVVYAPGGRYHNLLVALGRRTGEENFPVGESPKHVSEGQSYIDTVVTPYLNERL